MYGFAAILVPLNEHLKGDLTYLSRHMPKSVAIHDALGGEPVYLVDENPKSLIERFIKDLPEKQEAIVGGIKATPISFGFSNPSK